jgi:hypothetical protein
LKRVFPFVVTFSSGITTVSSVTCTSIVICFTGLAGLPLGISCVVGGVVVAGGVFDKAGVVGFPSTLEEHEDSPITSREATTPTNVALFHHL